VRETAAIAAKARAKDSTIVNGNTLSIAKVPTSQTKHFVIPWHVYLPKDEPQPRSKPLAPKRRAAASLSETAHCLRLWIATGRQQPAETGKVYSRYYSRFGSAFGVTSSGTQLRTISARHLPLS
jgi:hypothetical protein